MNSRVLRAFLIGALAVTLLDAGDGVVFFAIVARLNPIAVLQYIASGALGPAAFDGGLATAGVGLLIHVALAFGFSAAFFGLSRLIEPLRAAAIPSGLAYGALVWLFMNLLVLPHSGVAQAPLTTLVVIHGLIGHALFVGLPIGIAVKYFVVSVVKPRPATCPERRPVLSWAATPPAGE